MKQNSRRKTEKAAVSPDLIARAKAGDQAAFTALYEQTSPALYRAVRAMVRDEDLTWDILQESYLRAFRSLDKLEADGAFLPWLRRIAVNETARRMAKQTPVTFTELGGEDGALPELQDLNAGNQPEPALDRKETARLVQEILEDLPEQQHLILGMHYYEELSVREIAELLHVAPGTVKAQLHNGRKKVETRVRALEAQGVKLCGLSPVAFLVSLLRRLEPAAGAERKALGSILAEAPAAAGAEAGTVITAMTAGQAFFHGLAAKIAVGVLAAAVIGGGIWAGSRLLQSSQPAYGDEPPAVLRETTTAAPTESVPVPAGPIVTEPAEPVVTEPVQDLPVDPETEAEIRALFADPQGWYCRALTSRFQEPYNVDLYQFFYVGIPEADDALTQEEEAALIAAYPWTEDVLQMTVCTRLPRTEMDRVLRETFGMGLDQFSGRGLRSMIYLPETDCYYHFHGDTNLMNFRVEAVRQRADGTILFTYPSEWFWPGREAVPFWTVALQRSDAGGYRILSNLPGEWVTAADLGLLGPLLYNGTDPKRTETVAPDGTRTVRELTLEADGSLLYREGDPDSEFSYWATGGWWTGDGETLCFELWETYEDGNRRGPTTHSVFACTLEGDELILTQQSEQGFGSDEAGTELRFPWDGTSETAIPPANAAVNPPVEIGASSLELYYELNRQGSIVFSDGYGVILFRYLDQYVLVESGVRGSWIAGDGGCVETDKIAGYAVFSEDHELLASEGSLERMIGLKDPSALLGKSLAYIKFAYGPCHFDAASGIFVPGYVTANGCCVLLYLDADDTVVQVVVYDHSHDDPLVIRSEQ